jgi:sarcosine oxidase delta subunit
MLDVMQSIVTWIGDPDAGWRIVTEEKANKKRSINVDTRHLPVEHEIFEKAALVRLAGGIRFVDVSGRVLRRPPFEDPLTLPETDSSKVTLEQGKLKLKHLVPQKKFHAIINGRTFHSTQKEGSVFDEDFIDYLYLSATGDMRGKPWLYPSKTVETTEPKEKGWISKLIDSRVTGIPSPDNRGKSPSFVQRALTLFRFFKKKGRLGEVLHNGKNGRTDQKFFTAMADLKKDGSTEKFVNQYKKLRYDNPFDKAFIDYMYVTKNRHAKAKENFKHLTKKDKLSKQEEAKGRFTQKAKSTVNEISKIGNEETKTFIAKYPSYHVHAANLGVKNGQHWDWITGA